MRKKILFTIFTLVILISSITNIYAMENFIDIGAFETAYKLSNEAGMNLPFVNVFDKSAVYDETVKHSGITIGQSTIDVDEKLEGIHVIMSNDMITIKGEVEHGMIYGTNVVISGKVSGDTIIVANTVKILEGAIVEKDIVIVSDELEVLGNIKGHLIGAISKINVKGKIDGDLRVDTTDINIEQDLVKGNIYISIPESKTDKIEEISTKYPNAVIEKK